jgi:hypothetical protein
MIEFPPSFAVWGGTLLLARGNQGDLSECVRNSPPLLWGGVGFSSRTLSPSVRSLPPGYRYFPVDVSPGFDTGGGVSTKAEAPADVASDVETPLPDEVSDGEVPPLPETAPVVIWFNGGNRQPKYAHFLY